MRLKCGAAELFASVFFLLALRPLQDFDTFWQLQAGRYMAQTGSFIRRDMFSLAADVPRMEHCWLSDLIFYGLYSLGGYGLLGLIKPAVIGLCAWLLFRWADPGPQGERGWAAAVTALCLLASSPSWLVRPQLWTFVFSLLFLRLLYRGRSEGLRAWALLPVLMVPWANLHAGCVFGFVLVGIFGVGELVRVFKGSASRRSLGQLVAVGLSLPLAASINPYGYHIPLILLGNVRLHDVDLPSMAGVMEWLPPSWEQVPLFYLVMGLWGLSLLLRRSRAEAGEWLFFAAFIYMGLSQIRHSTLVALLAGFFLAPAALELARAARGRTWTAGLGWATALGLALVLGAQARAGNLGLGLKKDFYPVAAADFVLEKQLPGNLYNAYDWGGYLMWRLYPSYRVFLDGRSTSQEHFLASTLIDEARPGWQQTLRRYGVGSILIRTCYDDTGGPLPLVEALAASPDWVPVLADGVALVFVRRDLATGLEALPSSAVYDTQLEEARRLWAEDSARHRALLSQGRALLRLGRAAEARQALERFAALEPQDREGAFLLGLLEPGRGRR